ncbi:hypothetical protein TCAL_14456 [Tigriopus californicus]|uniref:Uncharacterized protein n=1 Tax=Tigriopus californicus TaxID=6832 RepID=A0A553PTY0_TIGCA|nr:hypothetical protein TCAL_14456 [Tigriopus californicus]
MLNMTRPSILFPNSHLLTGSDEWTKIAQPKVNHFLGKLVLLSGKPLLIGGCNHGGNGCRTEDEVEVYDSSQDKWFSKARLPKSKRSFTATVVDDGTKVITAGGMNGGSFINDVYSYTLDTNVWKTLNSLPSRVCCQIGGLVTLPDFRYGILLLGGVLNGRLRDWAFFLDLMTYKWEEMQDFEITGKLVYAGEMFASGSQLFVVPNYEDGIRKQSTRMLTRNMTDKNAVWIVNDDLPMSLGKNAQVAFEIKEYQYE